MASAGARKQQPARFMSIPDLLAKSDLSEEGLLRVIGRLEGYDVEHSILWVQDHKTPLLQVAVDSSNIEPFPFKQGLLYQFIGEVDYGSVPVAAGFTSPDQATTEATFPGASGRTKVDHIEMEDVDSSNDYPVSAEVTIGTEYEDSSVTEKDQVIIGDKMEVDVPVATGSLTTKRTVRCVVMKALLCRCVDGLDMDVYLRAHEVRMRLASASSDDHSAQ